MLVFDVEDEISLEVVIKDKEMILYDQTIGVSKVEISPETARKGVAKWYDVYKGDKLQGQILIETTYSPSKRSAEKDFVLKAFLKFRNSLTCDADPRLYAGWGT